VVVGSAVLGEVRARVSLAVEFEFAGALCESVEPLGDGGGPIVTAIIGALPSQNSTVP
jgi:hypothetical protein